jgi:hypothetical protein
MAGNNYLNIKINIQKEDICFTKDENPAPPSPFSLDDNDSSSNNIRVELGIAKVFHKVLNLIKTERDLFQKEDFELLGEMLSKILFGKINNQSDVRNYIMKEVEQTLEISNTNSNKICRIFLEFDQKSGVAMLPWEYTLYKTRSTKDSKAYYLSANIKSRFHLIRRVKENNLVFPETNRIFIMVLTNVDGNSDAMPPIDSRLSELPKIRKTFSELEKKFPDSLVIEYLEATPYNEIRQRVEEIYKSWEKQYDQTPCYILHYLGHAMLENQVGKLVLRNADTGKPEWVEDKKFASLFSEDKLNVKQPSVVCFQACDSAKIGSFDENLRGVAYEFTKINIPAVVGMQNEIDTPFSNAFFDRFYEGLLKAKDVAEAVTAGRDYLGREFDVDEDVYMNNSFGSPVLFITTPEPIRLIRLPEVQDTEKDRQVKIQEPAGPKRMPAAYGIENEKLAGSMGVDRATDTNFDKNDKNKGTIREPAYNDSPGDKEKAEGLKSTAP